MSLLSVLFLVFLVAAIAFAVVRHRAQWRSKCRAAAEKIHGEMTAMYRGEQEFRIAQETDFPGLDLTGYGEAREFLTASGFTYLGAIENLTITAVHPANRTFMAAYANEAGDITAFFYQMQHVRVQDFSTWLQGDRLLLTTNAEADKLTPAPSANRETLPHDTPPTTLLARHLERVQDLDAAEPGIIQPVSSLETVLDAARRYSGTIAEYRRSIGYLTEAEMLRLAAPGQEATARLVFQHFRELVERGGRA
jgi:hypothetical protein